jgi:hypothetical protein
MQKGEVSQTFAVNTTKYEDIKTSVVDNQSGEKSEDTTLSFMALLAPEATKISIEEDNNVESISKDIATLIDQKQVVSPEQRSTLNSYALSKEMQDAYMAKLAGKDATSGIRSRIKQIYSAFGLTYTDDSLSSNISNLSDTLASKFSIPPTYITNLGIVNNRLVTLEKISEDSPSREEFQKSLPNNLIFK